MQQYIPLSAVMLCALSATGCSVPHLNNVQAQEGLPESAEVEQVAIPYNPSNKKYVLVIEPFGSSQDIITYAHGETGTVPVGDRIAAQLTTAFSKVGNFSMVDYRHMDKLKLARGEKGPYIVRAVLTEFNEVAEAEADESGIGLGIPGAVLGIAGALAGKPGLMWTGAGLAAANPTLEDTQARRTGMVAFDVTIIDQRTGRVIDSFDSSGRFTAESAASGFSLFGIGSRKSAFASSALGQALRVAMNDTVHKAHDALVGL